MKSRTKGNEGWFSKFPKDIVLCEELTGGDTAILEKEPYIERNERPDYGAIFGSSSPKKKKKDEEAGKSPAGRKRKAVADSAKKAKEDSASKRPILHRRFQSGVNDHQVGAF